MDKEKLMKMMMEDKSESKKTDPKLMAEMDVLKELIEMADNAETGGLMEGLQKITVASPTKEGLKKGLEKAEEIVEEVPEEMMIEEDDDEMPMIDEEDEEDEEEGM